MLEQSGYLHLLKRWSWTLLLAAWVAGLVGYVVATAIPPTYEARARLLVGPVVTDVNTARGAEVLALTYAELAVADSRLRTVIETLDLDMTTNELEASVSVVANGPTRTMTISATNADPELAAAIANEFSTELIELATGPVRRPEGELTPFDPAEVPTTSSGTSASLIAFLSAAAGILVAGLLVAVLEYVSHTVKTKHDLASLTGVPVLGEINVGHGYVGSPVQPLVVEAAPASRTTHGYQLLATRIPLGEPGDSARLKSVLVVGSQSGEGTGEFTANLAAVIARSGRSVALIDADEVERRISSMFVPDGRDGLSELLALHPGVLATSDSVDRVRIRRVPDIGIIPAGHQPVTAVPEARARGLLEHVSAKADIVLISGASIDRSTTALTWARLVDASIVVARADVTRVEKLRVAVDSLNVVEAKLVGAVLLERKQRERLGLGRRSTAKGAGSERQTVGDKSAS